MKDAISLLSAAVLILSGLCVIGLGQPAENRAKQKVRTVSIPISIYTKAELKTGEEQEILQVERLIVRENGAEQTILSIRSVTDAPLALAIVLQDDLASDFNLQIRDLKTFVRSLPSGSRVMVAYARGGSLLITQKFTSDLAQAADSIRIVTSSNASSPRSPFESVADVVNRFEALPAGRRAILFVSDGLDLSSGITGAFPGQSVELDRAFVLAQRRSVAVFSIYAPTVTTENADSRLILFGQGALEKLSDETGGRAFFQGTSAAISFQRYFRDLSLLLNRQFLLSYLSTNMKRGYYKVQVSSTNPEVKIEHPKGYFYR